MYLGVVCTPLGSVRLFRYQHVSISEWVCVLVEYRLYYLRLANSHLLVHSHNLKDCGKGSVWRPTGSRLGIWGHRYAPLKPADLEKALVVGAIWETLNKYVISRV